MNYFRYIICKNFAVRKLLHNIVKIILLPHYRGLEYLEINKHIFRNLFYPSIYIMPIYYLIRKIFKIIKELFKL